MPNYFILIKLYFAGSPAGSVNHVDSVETVVSRARHRMTQQFKYLLTNIAGILLLHTSSANVCCKQF